MWYVIFAGRVESLSLDYFSSRSWGIHHQRIGKESGATRLGCTTFLWTSGHPSEKKPPKNYTPIYLLVDGSRRCEIYLGASLSSISLTPTSSSLPICKVFQSARHGRGQILFFPALFFKPWPQSSPRYRHQALNVYLWKTAI